MVVSVIPRHMALLLISRFFSLKYTFDGTKDEQELQSIMSLLPTEMLVMSFDVDVNHLDIVLE